MKLVCAHCGYSVEVGPGWYGEYFYTLEQHIKHDHMRIVPEDRGMDVVVRLDILGGNEESDG